MTATDLGSLLTLTGTFGRVSACRPGSYMHQRWGSSGVILGALKELPAPYLTEGRHETHPEQITRELAPGHEFHIQMLSPYGGSEQAMLQVKGTFSQILEILERVSWLIATLRSCKGGALTVSEVKAESFGSDELFVYSLLDQTAGRKPDPREAGQCWTSLFTESNLACGFGLYSHDRPDEMLGLDIPFDVVGAFARVEHPNVFEDQKLVADKPTLLTLVVIHKLHSMALCRAGGSLLKLQATYHGPEQQSADIISEGSGRFS